MLRVGRTVPPRRRRPRELELPLRSRVVLYSDDLSEAPSPSGEEYGTARIARHCEADAASVETLLGDVHGFLAGRPAADDQTVVMIRAAGAAAPDLVDRP